MTVYNTPLLAARRVERFTRIRPDMHVLRTATYAQATLYSRICTRLRCTPCLFAPYANVSLYPLDGLCVPAAAGATGM